MQIFATSVLVMFCSVLFRINSIFRCLNRGVMVSKPIFNENVFGLKNGVLRDNKSKELYHAIFFARLATNFR